MKQFLLLLSFYILTIGMVNAQGSFGKTEQTAGNQQVTIYPNPASSTAHIKFDNPSKVNAIAIYSIIGNEVFNKKVDQDLLKVNVQGLKRGKYIVRIFYNDGTSESQSLMKN